MFKLKPFIYLSLFSSCSIISRYKKFLQSKDLSVVSSDELNCVLGKRAREKTNERGREKTNKRGRENKEDTTEISHGITTITRKQTIQEYFATKLSRGRVRCVDNSLMEKDTQGTAYGVGLSGVVVEGGCEGGYGDGEGVESELGLVRAEGDCCEGDSGERGDGEGVESDLHLVTAEGDQHCEPRQKRRKTSSKKHKHLHKRH